MKVLAILCISTAAIAQPVTSRDRFDIDALPKAKQAECRKVGGCYVLTDEQLLNGLRAAHNAGLRSKRKNQP